MTPIEMKQEKVRSNPEGGGGSCKDGMKTAQSSQLGHPPNWSRIQSSSAFRRTGQVKLGGWPIWTGSARRMAELLTWSIQLGDPPSWSRGRSSSAIRRAGRVVDPARRMAELVVLDDPAQPSAELDGVLCPPFNKTYALNQTLGSSSSIDKHLTRLCSSAPQKRPIQRGPGRYVATELSRTSINGYDPNLCILVCSSMLAPMYRSFEVFDFLSS
ncbi:hypothetical protein F2Q70_00017809 [Brassica cretica]|uniref:Uncharacterized protein n=1 Tax=Brassica cretica TaxID=69181 RepID=A0A8S9KXN0_BRACR|nr:hypothetical protein F2Q70_00017809 [Brassica cretica]KAF2598457.1 hypothetical protein F2Q68_00010752 [Brassica cretica]